LSDGEAAVCEVAQGELASQIIEDRIEADALVRQPPL
jgi:hypothetical protein